MFARGVLCLSLGIICAGVQAYGQLEEFDLSDEDVRRLVELPREEMGRLLRSAIERAYREVVAGNQVGRAA